MTLTQVKYTIPGLGILLLMSFLYVKTQSINPNIQTQLLQHSSQFKQMDALLNQNILEIRQGLLPFYDPTVRIMNKLEQLQAKIAVTLAQLESHPDTIIGQHITLIDKLLMQKRELLEAFKSSNAVLRNSLSYLPLAANLVTTQLKHGEQQDILRHSIGKLLRDTLVFNLISDANLTAILNSHTTTLRQHSNHYPIKLRDDLHIFLDHVNIVIQHKISTDAGMQQLLMLPTAQRMLELQTAYVDAHNRRVEDINIYRLALYGLSLLLLSYIAYILIQLRRTTAHLIQTEAQSRRHATRLDGILNTALDAIVCTDKNSIITDWNPQAEAIFGWSAQEVLGQSLEETIIPPQHRQAHRQGLHHFLHNKEQGILGQRIEITALHQRGHEFPVELTVSSLTISGDIIFSAFIRDISERQQAETALRESEAYNRMLFEQSTMGLVLCRMNGQLVDINPAYAAIIGRSIDETLGLGYWDITPKSYAQDEQLQLDRLNKHGRYGPYEKEYQHRNGHLVPVRLQGMLVKKDGEQMIWSSVENITGQRQLEESLRRSQKMDAIGQLSGGIAHDFNNQLGVIIGYLDFLKDHAANNKKVRLWVDTATRATLRCMDLTRQLLTFARRQDKKKVIVNINELLKDMNTVIARSVTPEVDVQTSLADDIYLSEIDPDEFQDAILNLVINARDAMPDGGTLSITTRNKHLDEDYAALHPGIKAGDYVQLILNDTGIGMDKATQERVFEPFFTTKAEGKGTGLGLAMVYGFVQRYNGHINIYSEPNVGTTLRLYLPRSSATKTIAPFNNASQNLPPTGTESILVVDDEVDLLQLAGHYLTDLGYHPHLADTTTKALDILSSDIAIDLLFSDIVMPGGINGYELAQQASTQRPGLKVLLTSGFTAKHITNSNLAQFSAHLLAKPYRKAELAQRIRQVLDSEWVDSPSPQDEKSRKDQLKGRVILVVDDEADLRDLYRLNLAKLGCTTIEASNGTEAIALYQQSLDSSTAIDIIILDLTLPGGMGGAEIARTILKLNPQAKIIVSSGHTEIPEMTHYQDYGFKGALEKDFNRQNIKKLLEQLLTD